MRLSTVATHRDTTREWIQSLWQHIGGLNITIRDILLLFVLPTSFMSGLFAHYYPNTREPFEYATGDPSLFRLYWRYRESAPTLEVGGESRRNVY